MNLQVSVDADDGSATAANFYTQSIYLGNYSGNVYRSWYRFQNVTIPQGATILSAKLQFQARVSSYNANEDCNVRIYFEDADNPAAPSDLSNLTGRTLTTEYVDWTDIGAWSDDTWYDSPDLTDALQEVVDRGGFASGNAVIAHVLDNSSTSYAARRVWDRVSGAAYPAKLIVQYSI